MKLPLLKNRCINHDKAVSQNYEPLVVMRKLITAEINTLKKTK